MSTTRGVAEQIAADLGYQGGWQNQQALTEAIDQALQAERERLVRIAGHAFTPARTYASENADYYYAFDDGQRAVIKKIVAAIREGKPRE